MLARWCHKYKVREVTLTLSNVLASGVGLEEQMFGTTYTLSHLLNINVLSCVNYQLDVWYIL